MKDCGGDYGATIELYASGLLLIPLTVAQVVISTATGLRISSTGKPRNSMLFGLAGVCLLLFALVPMLHHGPFLVAFLTLFVGAGLGSTMPAAQTMVQWPAGNQELGEATAVLSFSRSVGGVLGTAITSAVLLAAQPLPGPHLAIAAFAWIWRDVFRPRNFGIGSSSHDGYLAKRRSDQQVHLDRFNAAADGARSSRRELQPHKQLTTAATTYSCNPHARHRPWSVGR